MILVDSSAWINFFNNPDSLHSLQIKSMLVDRLVASNKIIIAEILGGAKNKNDFKVLLEYFNKLEIFPIQDNDYDMIIDLNYSSIRKGYKIPMTDWIIAVNAFNNNALIYTLDKHFILIQKFLGITLYNSNSDVL